MLRFVYAIAAVMILGQSTSRAVDYYGFTLGMNQADAVSLAQRRGYNLRPTENGYFLFGSDGPDYLSFCGGRLFAAGKTFDGAFSTFIGLVRERQARWGEPVWKAEQTYVTGAQPVQQMSNLSAKWDDAVGQFQPDISLMTYGNGGLRISEGYSAWKYMCR